MTSDGSAYARFQRALGTRNLNVIVLAARELPWVGLRDALRVCLALAEAGDPRYERAVIRWVGRFCLEADAATLDDVEEAVAAFGDLLLVPAAARARLDALCARHALGMR